MAVATEHAATLSDVRVHPLDAGCGDPLSSTEATMATGRRASLRLHTYDRLSVAGSKRSCSMTGFPPIKATAKFFFAGISETGATGLEPATSGV
jgi:hypothetical protein